MADRVNRTLTRRRKRFVAEYTNPNGRGFLNGTRAALAAGYAKSGARTEGSRLLANADIRAAVAKALDEAGATLERAAQVLAEGMDSKSPKVAFDGKRFHYSKALPDRQERRLSAEVVLRLRGAYPTTQEQERLALLAIQQNFYVVPPDKPERKALTVEGREVED